MFCSSLKTGTRTVISLLAMLFTEDGILCAQRQPAQRGLERAQEREHVRHEDNIVAADRVEAGRLEERLSFRERQQDSIPVEGAAVHRAAGERVRGVVFDDRQLAMGSEQVCKLLD